MNNKPPAIRYFWPAMAIIGLGVVAWFAIKLVFKILFPLIFIAIVGVLAFWVWSRLTKRK